MAQSSSGVKLCFGDVRASWGQVAFCTILLTILVATTIDLFTTSYSLHATEHFLTWLHDEDMLAFIGIFIVFGSVSIVLLLPQTVLFLAAGYSCSERISNKFAAFIVALNLSLVTFILGASIAFLMARSILPPTCTRKFFRHFAILDGLDHALRHKGRRIIFLLRVNPMAPYNALNYGLGLSSCTFLAYQQGMLGAVPFTSIAVYAGMVISSVDDIDSLFTYTSTGWYCVYAALAVACVVSFIAIVRYTSAEMKAIVRSAPIPDAGAGAHENGSCRGGVDCAVDGDEDFGELPPDTTMFGTFSSGGGDEGIEPGVNGARPGEVDEAVVAREPLLSVDQRRKKVLVPEGVQGRKGARKGSVVDV